MGDSFFVYSERTGSRCPESDKSIDKCSCNPCSNPQDGLRQFRFLPPNKGRKAKIVKLIKGLRMNPSDLKAYVGKIMKKIRTGNSLRDGVIEIQGVYRDKVGENLKHDSQGIRRDLIIKFGI